MPLITSMPADPLTIQARTAAPYVHVDERAIVLFDGFNTVVGAAPRLPRVAETIDILLREGRATRTQQEWTFGGYVAGDDAVLYAADDRAAASVTVSLTDLRTLRASFGSHVAGASSA